MRKRLISLMQERRLFGIQQYGVPVNSEAINPGHLLEEALDGAVYAEALHLQNEGVLDEDVWMSLAEKTKTLHLLDLPRCDSYRDVVMMMISVSRFLLKGNSNGSQR